MEVRPVLFCILELCVCCASRLQEQKPNSQELTWFSWLWFVLMAFPSAGEFLQLQVGQTKSCASWLTWICVFSVALPHSCCSGKFFRICYDMPALFLRKLKSLRSVLSHPLLFYSVIFSFIMDFQCLWSFSIKNMHGQINGEFLCVSEAKQHMIWDLQNHNCHHSCWPCNRETKSTEKWTM